MIEIEYEDHSTVRLEAARVILPGFDYLEAYAVPHSRWKGIINHDKWMIVDGVGRRKYHLRGSNGFKTIEKAIANAVRYCKSRRVTPKKYRARLVQLGRSPSPPVAEDGGR